MRRELPNSRKARVRRPPEVSRPSTNTGLWPASDSDAKLAEALKAFREKQKQTVLAMTLPEVQ